MFRFAALSLSGFLLLLSDAQETPHSASQLLQRALYRADLNNWADAASDFVQAEKMFLDAGDARNALYAKLGRIRSTIEQHNLELTSAELATELDTNPLLQSDKQLRL
ncbi:MAG: hypothetical protein ACRD7E_05465 [Bryobacteraceae bacterium]